MQEEDSEADTNPEFIIDLKFHHECVEVIHSGLVKDLAGPELENGRQNGS